MPIPIRRYAAHWAWRHVDVMLVRRREKRHYRGMRVALYAIPALLSVCMVVACGDDDASTTGSGGATSSSATTGAGGQGGGGMGGMGGMQPDPNLPPGCWTGPPPQCNPLNNAVCGDDFSCDLGTNGFKCFPQGMDDAAEGEACNPSSGPFCMPTLHCREAVCRRYCCSDSDCNGETCEQIQPQNGTVGVCPVQ